MTYRHYHCVYYQYDDPKKVEGFCLLKQEKIDYGYTNHCDCIVLRPSEVLMMYIEHEEDTEYAVQKEIHKATQFLDEMGLNDYPRIQKEVVIE